MHGALPKTVTRTDYRNPYGYDWSPSVSRLKGDAFVKAITRPLIYTRFDFFFDLAPKTHGPAYGWGGPTGRPPKARKKPWGHS